MHPEKWRSEDILYTKWKSVEPNASTLGKIYAEEHKLDVII